MFASQFRSNRHLLRLSRRSSQRSLAQFSYNTSPSPLSLCYSCRQSLLRLIDQKASKARYSSSTNPTLTSDSLKARPIPKTHYEFFPKTLPKGPPPDGPFHIDVRQLRNEFLQLQAVAHPDRHPSSLKTRAEATSARINEAYKTLQNPLLRAQYLLSLRGINIAEDETAKVEDPELLMEVLETREEIEAAQEESDLDELKRANKKRIEASEGIIEEGFRTDDIKVVVAEAVKLRYWVNIKESLHAWERGKPAIIVH